MPIGHPYFKFYPRDWRGDQALRACSEGARCAWIEMLCIMHEADPYGHLLVGKVAPTLKTLAQMVGIPMGRLQGYLQELEAAGVFSRTSNGVIFSRRMVKDFARSTKGLRAAQKRWTDTEIIAETEKPIGSGIGSPTGSPNGTPTRSLTGKPFAHRAEGKGQRAKRESQTTYFENSHRAERAAGASDFARALEEAFGRKYKDWPQHLRNLQPVMTMIDNEGVSFEEELVPMVRKIARRGTAISSWEYVRRAIIGEREGKPVNGGNGHEAAVEDEAKWRWRLEKARERKEWCSEAWGPMPYTEGCRVPEHLWADGDASGWRDVPDRASD